MDTPKFAEIRQALKAKDKDSARDMLRPILKNQPSAEAWYLAALSVDEPERQLGCLRRALQYDALHSGANRMLMQLEGAKRDLIIFPETPVERSERAERLLDTAARKHTKPKNRRRRRRLGCLLWFIISSICSMTLVMNLLGVWTGLFGLVGRVSSGVEPLTLFDNTPIEYLAYPVNVVPVALSQEYIVDSNSPTLNTLDHGLAHEYAFAGYNGRVYALTIGFVSAAQRDFTRNVAVYDPEGNDITESRCQQSALPEEIREQMPMADQLSVLILACPVSITGSYRVKIAGVKDESTGLYVLTVNDLGSF